MKTNLDHILSEPDDHGTEASEFVETTQHYITGSGEDVFSESSDIDNEIYGSGKPKRTEIRAKVIRDQG